MSLKISEYEQNIRQQILAYRDAGKENFINYGASLDKDLAAEIDNPGSDQRHGVNLITRPPLCIKEYILSIQNYLRKQVGATDQYYYPLDDLHVTLMEISSSQTFPVVSETADRILENIDDILRDAPAAEIHSPILVFDNRAVSISFIPVDQGLETMRRSIFEKLNTIGIHVLPRYHEQAAHVTLMRYIAPLQTDIEKWCDIITNSPGGAEMRWNINEVWLTWGATWYGIRSRIQESGPYKLVASVSPAIDHQNSHKKVEDEE